MQWHVTDLRGVE